MTASISPEPTVEGFLTIGGQNTSCKIQINYKDPDLKKQNELKSKAVEQIYSYATMYFGSITFVDPRNNVKHSAYTIIKGQDYVLIKPVTGGGGGIPFQNLKGLQKGGTVEDTRKFLKTITKPYIK